IDRHWSDGRGTTTPERQEVDDVGFVAALIAELIQTHAVDPQRVFATGISNGGIFVHRLGCALAERIAAVGPIAGTMAELFAPRCAPRPAVSVVAFHGTDDQFVPWTGGVVRGSIGGRVLSVADTTARWAALNHCPSTPQRVAEPERDAADGTRVRRETYAPCRDGSAVVLYAIDGGGHTWPGGPAGRLPASGRVSREISATEILWQFFAAHPKR
ncbi:MAG: esterase, partial [Armatimonadetes bacterium]|nr:esterase [Armatimonadota bacterium]